MSGELQAELYGWWRIVETSQWGRIGHDCLGPALLSLTEYEDQLRKHGLFAYVNVIAEPAQPIPNPPHHSETSGDRRADKRRVSGVASSQAAGAPMLPATRQWPQRLKGTAADF